MNRHEIAHAVADLVNRKQEQYGDSFGKSETVLKTLYPNGIPPEQLRSALTVVRVVDKLFRIATNNDPTGESPWRDIVGYGLLELSREEK